MGQTRRRAYRPELALLVVFVAGCSTAPASEERAPLAPSGNLRTRDNPTDCHDDLDCWPSGHCNNSVPGRLGQCVDDCTVNTCKQGEYCGVDENNPLGPETCQPGCDQMTDCPKGQICNFTTEECEPGCVVDENCDQGFVCTDGDCLPGCKACEEYDCSKPGLCEDGTSERGCGDGDKCVDSECVALTGTGPACFTLSQCANTPGTACYQNECTPLAQIPIGQCPVGTYSDGTSCKLGCSNSPSCMAQIQLCLTDAANIYCNGNACSPNTPYWTRKTNGGVATKAGCYIKSSASTCNETGDTLKGDRCADLNTILEWDGDDSCQQVQVVQDDETCTSVCETAYPGQNRQGECLPADADCGGGRTVASAFCQCDCPPEMQECNGVCTDLATDQWNCGTCGRACQRGCYNGACLECPVASQTKCDNGGCYDLLTDPYNCGACGNGCALTEGCDNGHCVTVILPPPVASP
jgi:hypothetical protein